MPATAQQNTGKFQPYDPSTPYQAPVLPDPQPTTPSPLPTQMPQANGAVGKSGAIATIADGILRGFMNGKAQGEASKAMKLKKKTDDLQNSYNQDAVRLYQLTQAGISETSDEYKAAKSSVDGSWGALMDFYGGHIQQMTGEKKGKGKKTQDQRPPQAVLADPTSTPYEKAQAWYQVSQKAGAPVYGQIAMINTPEAKQNRANQAAMPGLQAGEIAETQYVQAAQATMRKYGQQYAELRNRPKDSLAPAEKKIVTDYEQAYNVVNPPKPEAAPKPGDQTKVALDDLVGRISSDKNYKLTDADREIFRANKIDVNPKSKITVTGHGEIIEETPGANPPYRVLRGPQKGYGGAGGSGEVKTYQKWVEYYADQYPDMPKEEREALAHRKVEGAGQEVAGALAHDAVAEPKQFDNGVISAAISNLRNLPQYKDNPKFDLDGALTNLVGQGDYGYQYHARNDLGKPDRSGKYAGDVDEAQLKKLEVDLQNQIHTVMNSPKETALTPTARRTALGRMRPLFGPASEPTSGATSPESPQAGAPSAAPPSSGAPKGGEQGKKKSKGEVWKSDFLRENKGATEGDWNTMKVQLKNEGYDPVDK